MGLVERVEQICHAGLGERELRVAVLAEVRPAVPFDCYAWLLTDPVSRVGWSPVAEVPVLAELPGLIRAKYLTTVNRWTGLVAGVPVTWATAGRGGAPHGHLLWDRLRSEHTVTDVASLVLADRSGCWGFVDLWRRGGEFTAAECASLGAVAGIVTPALRRALLPAFSTLPGEAREPVEPADGPAVMLLDAQLRPVAQTASTDRYLRALLPAEPGQAVVPAAALNVAAQLCAVEAGITAGRPEARVFVPGRSWMTVRAGRIEDPAAGSAAIAVTIETTEPTRRTDLYAGVAGLTDRETAVLHAVAAGHDTRHSADRLGISQHTVQDHLKSIFAKTGTDSRRLLTARATGAAR